MTTIARIGAALALAVSLSACASTSADGSAASASASSRAQADDGDLLMRMFSGRSATEGEALDALVAKASAFPLGSEQNPVRAQMPEGQRAYLSRLRCADLSRPTFFRQGSFGVGVYGNILDAYEVTCEDSEPAKAQVFMDMYHPGHIEEKAVPGFGIVGGQRED